MNDLRKRTLELFGPRSPVPLTDADCDEITRDMLAFVAVMRRWAEAEMVNEGGAPDA